MIDHIHEPARSHDFSVAFRQMCAVVAISDTRGADETLRQLILQCFVILPDGHFRDEQNLVAAVNGLFGLQLPVHEVRAGMDRLIRDGMLQRTAGDELELPIVLRAKFEARIEETIALERGVREEWFDEITRGDTSVGPDQAWRALISYLAKAFRCHGLQTTALLDPSIDIPAESAESLSSLLEETLNEFSPERRAGLRRAITSFLSEAGKHAGRATYIAQLADGAFNYFSLTVAPDVAEHFRKGLRNLTVFLDTNFLYGILDLAVPAQVSVASDLLRAISAHSLPFTLVYHPRTLKELRTSIDGYKTYLGSRAWPIAISRAAATSTALPSVVVKYHQRRLETGVDVESFFRPYAHIDVMLDAKGICVYNPSEDRTAQRGSLYAEYEAWLKEKGRDKGHGQIDHDATVLDQVRHLRSTVGTSLDAGALLVTCDHTVYKFDWEWSKRVGRTACAVLPNLFWQVLRPYVPSGTDFDKSFAETFAIPEFRIVGDGAAKASAKLLSILAGYRDVPEETASRMLSNDLLINRLKTAQDDEEFQDYVDAAIVAENIALREEKAGLIQKLEAERSARVATEAELERERLKGEQDRAGQQQDAARQEREALQRQEELKRAVEQSKAKLKSYTFLAAVLSSVLSVGVFELIVFGAPWEWLTKHPNSYGIQAAVDAILFCFWFGLFMADKRVFFWIGGLVAFGATLIQLLGGPVQSRQ